MKLAPEEISEINELLQGMHLTKEAQLMKQFVQHGHTSTYDHVVSVTQLSFYLNRRLHLGAPDAELVRGAFLHDFYLYDWHDGTSHKRLHGFHHPAAALRNAMRHYALTPMEQNIIRSHMWPLTLFSVPRCRAAVIVCIADKICSARETVEGVRRCIVISRNRMS